jgi:hypothetical protein
MIAVEEAPDMELADVARIPDFSNETLLGLAERLESSRTFQEHIIREVELDEVFRRVDTAVRAAEQDGDMDSVQTLQTVRALVFEAHDLAGHGLPADAARKLRAAMSIEPRR